MRSSAVSRAVLLGMGLLSGLAAQTATVATNVSSEATATDPSTFPGPNGVESRWVVAENARRGTSSWKIVGTSTKGFIEGFASTTYAARGQVVTLYVSSSAPRFRVDAYRMGYYQGYGARLVWSSARMTGVVQPPCPVSKSTNTVSCDDWKASLRVAISSSFVEGDYLLKLVGSGSEQSYVPLTVWNPTSHAAYLLKNDVLTWQAWNPYGGYDFYQGLGSCVSTYPVCNRARVVSYDRPYAYGDGAADFLAEEYPLVELAERRGLDVAYGTDVTVEQHPSIVGNHKVLLSLGHDECWALVEREAVQSAAEKGLNVVFFGASPMLRHVRLQSSPLGVDREVVDYRDSTEDPLDGKGNQLLVTGNTWGSPPASWSEVPFVGEAYAGYLEPNAPHAAFVVADAAAWVFRGTGLGNGSSLPGVLASDYDELEPDIAHPSNVEILGHSPIPGTSAYSDMTYYTMPESHAGILDSGTNNWIPALACGRGPDCSSLQVARITRNILSVLGRGPAGRYEPSLANRPGLVGAIRSTSSVGMQDHASLPISRRSPHRAALPADALLGRGGSAASRRSSPGPGSAG